VPRPGSEAHTGLGVAAVVALLLSLGTITGVTWAGYALVRWILVICRDDIVPVLSNVWVKLVGTVVALWKDVCSVGPRLSVLG
jgi:hypothetical protein